MRDHFGLIFIDNTVISACFLLRSLHGAMRTSQRKNKLFYFNINHSKYIISVPWILRLDSHFAVFFSPPDGLCFHFHQHRSDWPKIEIWCCAITINKYIEFPENENLLGYTHRPWRCFLYLLLSHFELVDVVRVVTWEWECCGSIGVQYRILHTVRCFWV